MSEGVRGRGLVLFLFAEQGAGFPAGGRLSTEKKRLFRAFLLFFSIITCFFTSVVLFYNYSVYFLSLFVFHLKAV
jgi:hypothetical protein